MSRRLHRLVVAAAVTTLAWAALGGYYWARQQSLLFFPETLPRSHRFSPGLPFEEVEIDPGDGVLLNGLYFPADNAVGAAYYLHGNGGSLRSWSSAAADFVRHRHDVLMIDYRGYGKSGGSIESEAQLHADIEAGYRWLGGRWEEARIVVVGYSLGSALAARIGCESSPRHLVLHAPFFSIPDAARQVLPLLRLYPDLLFRFRLRIDEDLDGCPTPITIVHGEGDQLIPIAASERLARLFKPGDRLIRLAGAGHNGLRHHPGYESAIRSVLESAVPIP